MEDMTSIVMNRCKDNDIMDLKVQNNNKNIMKWCELDSSGSGLREGCCTYGHELQGSKKEGVSLNR
jgi:hypothetical protein